MFILKIIKNLEILFLIWLKKLIDNILLIFGILIEIFKVFFGNPLDNY